MKNTIAVVLCGLLFTTSIHAQRVKYNFNSSWKVFVGDDSFAINNDYNDNNWKKVTLPYAWNEDEAFKKDIVNLSTGIAWYRKHFKLPASAAASVRGTRNVRIHLLNKHKF